MKRKILILYFLMLCVLLAGCQCKHEWVDADCVTPRTCSLCQQTEGEVLGHSWSEATCEEPKTCVLCHETEGEALGHTLEYSITTTDIITCDRTIRNLCTVCNEILETEPEKLTTLSEDGMFIFSPEQFMQRFEYCAKQTFPDFHYEITTSEIESMNQLLCVTAYLDNTDSESYCILFFNSNSIQLSQEDFQTPGLWCVCLGKSTFIDTNSTHSPIPGDLAKAFYLACDPLFSDSDYGLHQATYLASYLNWVDFGESPGYIETNALLYEFGHAISKSNDQYIDIEVINVYAANWL